MPKDGFYESLYRGDKKEDDAPLNARKPYPESHEEALEHLAGLPKTEDEALVGPWTHKLTIYCKDPSKEFISNIKNGNCVVAVFEKKKESSGSSLVNGK